MKHNVVRVEGSYHHREQMFAWCRENHLPILYIGNVKPLRLYGSKRCVKSMRRLIAEGYRYPVINGYSHVLVKHRVVVFKLRFGI